MLDTPADTPPEGTPISRSRHWSRLLLVTVALQCVYWLGIEPLLFGGPDMPPRYAVGNFEVAELPAPDAASLAQAKFTPAELPWTSCCGPGYRAARFDVEIPQVPEEGIAIVPQVDADNLQVRINGQLVDSRGRMTLPRPTHEVNVKRVIHVPPAVFHAGSNRVEYVMVRSGAPYFDVLPPIFADYSLAWPLFKFREFILTDFELMGVAVGAVIALFAGVLLLRSSQRGLALALLVLVPSWALLVQFYFWVDPPLAGGARLFYYFALANLLPVGWLNFSDQWTGRPLRRLAPISAAAYVLCMALTLWALRGLPPPDGFDLASDTANWFGIVISAAAILRFLWHVARGGDQPALEFGVFALCITLLAVDLVNELLWDNSTNHSIRCMPLLLIAFLAAFLARNMRLFQSTSQINQLLRARLDAREAELAVAHRRESELVRREAHHTERQRLMRDMHDGVGSQLTALLFAARRGSLTAPQAAESLQSVMDEIRVLIDSMDSTRESLPAALEKFRQRIAQGIEGTDVSLDFPVPARELLPDYGPREVLQVMRILQEACSNALRHSGCSRVEVDVRATGDPAFPAQLSVRDNGRGFAGEIVPGRGLANMEARAATIGARLHVRRDGPGVEVCLQLAAAGAVAAV